LSILHNYKIKLYSS